MKHTHLTKRVLACSLALAMATTTVGVYPSLKVSAAKKKTSGSKAKAKAKLSKKKASVIEGKTITLSVKKANKKVKWSVKNKKVVAITKTSGKKKEKATVKGLKKGSTIVTAKVGKQKLTCKVTVQESAIKSIAIDQLDNSALILTFAKTTVLNAADAKIQVKKYGNGSYNANPKIEALTTSDQKTYRLYLTNGVSNGDYVKVTVGKNSKEMQVKKNFVPASQTEAVLLAEKDVVINGGGLDSLFKNNVGTVSYSLKKGSKLPDGLTLAGKKGIIKGIPTTVGNTTVTIVAKDEIGRTAETNYTIKVYDETALAVKDQEEKLMLDDYVADYTSVITPLVSTTSAIGKDSTYVKRIKVSPKGGSGMYKYSITAADTTVKISTDEYNAATNTVTKKAASEAEVLIPYGLAEGEHSYTVTIEDAADATRTTTATVKFTVTSCYNLGGNVKDAMGAALQGGERVYFIPSTATDFSEKIGRTTYLKYKYTNGKKELVQGNSRNTSNTDIDWVTDDLGFATFDQDASGVVGPLPKPTILEEAPTMAPAITPTVAPTAVPGSTAAPAEYKVPDLAAGAYEAEVPAGEYIVKVEGANGVKYQLDGTVNVTTDKIDLDLTLPVRFINATATMKYANGQIFKNQYVYFETENKQYESWEFSAKTNYLGQFNASIPAGNYKVYIKDEEGNKVYLDNSIVVGSDTVEALGDLTLPIARYTVSGIANILDSTTTSTTPTTVAFSNETLYFFNKKGKCVRTAQTQKEKIKDATKNEWVDNKDKGKFELLLADGEYAVRTYINGKFVTIGRITVAGADVANQQFTYSGFDKYLAGLSSTPLTLGQEAILQTTGNNDVVAKFTVTEAARYDITSCLNLDSATKVSLYKEDGTTCATESLDKEDGKSVVVSDGELAAGNYYIVATPYSYSGYNYSSGYYYYSSAPEKQELGVISLKVEKHVENYAKYASDIAADGTERVVNCTKNVDKDVLNGVAYIKMGATPGTKYKLTYATNTIGIKDINVSIADYSSARINYNDDREDVDVDSTNGVIEFTANKDLVYLKVRVDGEYMNAGVKVKVENAAATAQSPSPSPTVQP